MITPFTPEGEVDYDALRRLVDYQIGNGADFLCALGTTAETPCLTAEERWKVRKTVVEVNNGRVPVLMGCGGNNTAGVVEALKTTDFDGIDGVLSVCPYYNKPTQEGLYQHYKALAQASPLPVVLYNVPGRTGVNLKAETTVRLANDFTNIVAVKEASGNLEQAATILRDKPADFDVLCGDDALAIQMLADGASGVVSVIGNAMTRDFSRMIHLLLKGDRDSANQINQRFADLYSLLFVDGNPAGVKAILDIMGFCHNVLRLPLVPVSDDTMMKIKEKVEG